MKGLSLIRGSMGGPGGSFFTGDPGRYVKKVRAWASLSVEAPLSLGNPV
jgi:alpha-D-ribose 1-methylphosphonate 5-triphosphate synthase subunit PhnG